MRLPQAHKPDKGLTYLRIVAWFDKTGRKRPRRYGRKSAEGEREPVAPDKPNLLSGGAAAALEFDD